MSRGTMKVARYYAGDDIRIEEMPVPPCGPHDILVETRACGICSGELMEWYMRPKAPFVFGHEPSGVVVEVGREVQGWQVGDRVFVHHHAPCFTCRHCRRGAYVMCETWRRSRLDPGGMAQYIRVPAENQRDTLRLPDHVGWDAGALVEPLACAVQALERSRMAPGDTVLVIGLGFMGQLLARTAWSFGAGMVIAADFEPARRALARSLGASHVLDPALAPLHEQVAELTGGAMAEVVLVGPPTVAAMQAGVQAAGRGATVVLFSPAPPGERWPIEPHDLYFRDVAIVPSYSCGPRETRRALALLAGGAIPVDRVITHRYPFPRVAEGFRAMKAGGEVVKVLIEFAAG